MRSAAIRECTKQKRQCEAESHKFYPTTIHIEKTGRPVFGGLELIGKERDYFGFEREISCPAQRVY